MIQKKVSNVRSLVSRPVVCGTGSQGVEEADKKVSVEKKVVVRTSCDLEAAILISSGGEEAGEGFGVGGEYCVILNSS